VITKKDLRLGKTIRKFRRQADLTQQELADKVGVSQKYIQYLESAKRTPSVKILRKILNVLKIKTEVI